MEHNIMEQLMAIWASLSLSERKKFLIDESINILGSFIESVDEAGFYAFLKQLGTLADMGAGLGIEMDFALKERDIKAKVKALCEDAETFFIDESFANRLSDLSNEAHEYLAERQAYDAENSEEDAPETTDAKNAKKGKTGLSTKEQVVYDNIKKVMSEQRREFREAEGLSA